MGVPTSEVGYTIATTRSETTKVHKNMWWHWRGGGKGKKKDLFFRARIQHIGNVPRPILISPSCSKASLVSRNVYKVYRTVTDVSNDLSPKSSVQTVQVFTLSMVRGSAHKVRVLYSKRNP